MLELHLLVDLDILLTPLAKDLDESIDLLLRVSVRLETPALSDFGDRSGQMVQRRFVVEA